MRRPLNTVWKIPKHLTSHTRAYAYFSNILFNLCTILVHIPVTAIGTLMGGTPKSLTKQI